MDEYRPYMALEYWIAISYDYSMIKILLLVF